MKKYKWMPLLLLTLSLAGCQGNQDTVSWLDKGMEAIEQNQYEEAVRDFEASITADEDVLQAYRGIGIAYIGSGEYEKAVSAFDQALDQVTGKMEETQKDILYYKASALYKQGEYNEVIDACNKILAISKESVAYYLRGASYLELNDTERAKVNFDAAVEATPRDFDLYLNIYESYSEKKLSAEGDVYLQKALAIETENDDEVYEKARIYFALEDNDAAKDALTTLVENKEGKALLLMGQVYLAMDDPAHSRTMYQQYIELYDASPQAYNGIALADIAEESYDSALENINNGLALDQEEGKQELYFNEIVVYEYLLNFEMAREKAAAYVEAYPQDEAGQKEYEFLKSR